MAVTSGTKFGPYEIQSALGVGGMGEVYRANDTRLDRTVAIKVLAAHLSSSPELKQRISKYKRAKEAPHVDLGESQIAHHQSAHHRNIDAAQITSRRREEKQYKRPMDFALSQPCWHLF